jgi:hypothetical protein
MDTSDRVVTPARTIGRPQVGTHGARARRRRLSGGGTDGNERLTTFTGIVLLVLLLVIGVTILRMRQLISVHLFVGLLLIGPVLLKMASTGYRFVRYYTGNAVYRRKGPPEAILRMIAPVVVLSTVTVFVSGVILMFQGRAHRDPMLLIHKVSFIVWLVFFGLHVVGHLPEVLAYIPGRGGAERARELRALRESLPGLAAPQERAGHVLRAEIPGRTGRSIALAVSLVGGLILAIVLIPHFGGWTHHLADFGHEH